MLSILLVDDDEDDYRLTEECLSLALDGKFDLVWSSSYDVGIQAMNRGRFDVVFVDHFLKGRLGLDFITEAFRISDDPLFVMLTGASDKELDLKALAAGAGDFLTKGDLSPTLLSRVIRYGMHRNNKNRRLRQAQAEVERSKKETRKLLANITHEVRAPLIGILNSANHLAELVEGEEAKTLTEQICLSSEVSLDLISEILEYSKYESGRIELDSHPFDLAELVDQTTAIIKPQLEEKKLLIETDCEAVAGRYVGDASKIRQVLVNLLSNAVKFTEYGLIRFLVTRDPDSAMMQFEVTDPGIGMTPEQCALIFEPFRQADGSIHARFGGTGLGLAISLNLATAMNGTIAVESVPGEGSTFRFSLPLSPDVAPPQIQAPVDFSRKTALIVDDDNGSRYVLHQFLTRMGFQVKEASDGRIALEKAMRRKYDVVFLDLNMPGLDGYETAHAMAVGLPKVFTPVIIGQTAHTDPEIHRECKMAGMIEVLVKPLKYDALERLLREVLR